MARAAIPAASALRGAATLTVVAYARGLSWRVVIIGDRIASVRRGTTPRRVVRIRRVDAGLTAQRAVIVALTATSARGVLLPVRAVAEKFAQFALVALSSSLARITDYFAVDQVGTADVAFGAAGELAVNLWSAAHTNALRN